MERLAQRFLRCWCRRKAILVGDSLGGWIAMGRAVRDTSNQQ
jgi:hypothetical protein